jgi:LuxR family maltose regulon positive regulatory protein
VTMDAYPSLWVTHALTLLATGQRAGVEAKLQAAEAALRGGQGDPEPDNKTRDLIGRIAATRATLAWGQYDAETIVTESQRALEHLQPDNLPFRTSTIWKLGTAYQLQGDGAAASQAYAETISICEESGNTFINIMASIGLGQVQAAELQLHSAAKTYRRVLEMVGDPPLLVACGAYLGLARILYEWNDLDAAELHGQQGIELARNIDSNDAFALCGLFLARLKLAQGDVAGAAGVLAEADQFVRSHNFGHRMPDLAAAQVLVLLAQGSLVAAADLAEKNKLFVSQARVHLARGDAVAALTVLEPQRRKLEAKGWQAERLELMVVQAAALQEDGQKDEAMRLLGDALALAERGDLIRTFVDGGPPMTRLLGEAVARGMMADYVAKLLAAFENETKGDERGTREKVPPLDVRPSPALVEPLSARELEVLQLIADGMTNQEIASRLYLALNTVKAHTRNIYGKLGANSRTQAVAKARALRVLPTF